jgi:ParB family chromosome partitioning protein
MKRKALGRGLDALIPKRRTAEGEKELDVDIDLISPNPYQPRDGFDEGKIEQLARSIRANGVIQPLIVRPTKKGYQIVAGERRWRAAQHAGFLKVPVVVRQVPDDKLLELSLIENIQREELNPIEEARAYHVLVDKFKLTQEEIARRVGKDRSSVANYLRLLKLPSKVQDELMGGKVTMGHARALLGLDEELQLALLTEVINRDYSVRETERAVNRIKRGGRKRKETVLDPFITEVVERLSRALSTKVEIRGDGGKGRIIVHFYSREELDRIFNRVLSH